MIPLGAMLAALSFAQDKSDARAVQVREAVLRDKPSFLGKVVGRLKYGASVTVEEKKGAQWLRVRGGDASGWLAATAVTAQGAKLRAGSGEAGERAGATSRSLAGRGFDEKAEASRRSQGGDVAAGYRKLDELLAEPAYNPDPAAVPEFAAEGGLGGGQ